jgi:hypothetical protein
VFDAGQRKRARPGIPNAALSAGVSAAGLYVASALPFTYAVEPLLAALVVSLPVALLRLVRLKAGVPPPHGGGKVTVVDSMSMYKSGALLLVAGVIVAFGLIASVFFVPTEFTFLGIFGVISGLPLSQVLFFAAVSLQEMRYRSRIFLYVEEVTEDGVTTIRKSVELVDQPVGRSA